MISDNELYSLAIFLGSLSVLLIVIYHFLEFNTRPDEEEEKNGLEGERSNGGGKQQGLKG